MDPRLRLPALCCCYLFLLSIFSFYSVHGGGTVFRAKRKLIKPSIHDMRKHDSSRRLLSVLDVPLGGNIIAGYVIPRFLPLSSLMCSNYDEIYQSCRMFYTEVEIGTPPKKFKLLVDTGSPVMWVDCEGCKGCMLEDPNLSVRCFIFVVRN